MAPKGKKPKPIEGEDDDGVTFDVALMTEEQLAVAQASLNARKAELERTTAKVCDYSHHQRSSGVALVSSA